MATPRKVVDLVWPPYTAAEQIALWKQREFRYVLRKVKPSPEERRSIAVARQQDVGYLPLDERDAAMKFLATLRSAS